MHAEMLSGRWGACHAPTCMAILMSLNDTTRPPRDVLPPSTPSSAAAPMATQAKAQAQAQAQAPPNANNKWQSIRVSNWADEADRESESRRAKMNNNARSARSSQAASARSSPAASAKSSKKSSATSKSAPSSSSSSSRKTPSSRRSTPPGSPPPGSPRPPSSAPGPSSYSSRSGPSPARMEAYAKCAADNRQVRSRYQLDNVTYGNTMSDAEIENLLAYIRANFPAQALPHFVTYTHLDHLNQRLLCRFPRPSELNRLAAIMTRKPGARLAYSRAELTLQAKSPTAFARFVGPLGANFAFLTRESGLIYMWLQPGDAPNQRVLRLYALRSASQPKGTLPAAVQYISDMATKQYGIRVLSTAIKAISKPPGMNQE